MENERAGAKRNVHVVLNGAFALIGIIVLMALMVTCGVQVVR